MRFVIRSRETNEEKDIEISTVEGGHEIGHEETRIEVNEIEHGREDTVQRKRFKTRGKGK